MARTSRRNRQQMWYSYQVGKAPGYLRDENGDIQYESYVGADGEVYFYTDDEGKKIPKESGEMEVLYSNPVKFWGTITSQLKNAIMRAWGSDSTNNYATLILAKHAKDSGGNELNLPFGARIWLHSEIETKPNGSPDENSADYQVSGIMNEALNETSYYLQVLQQSEEKT